VEQHNKITVVDENDVVVGALDLFEAIRKGCIRRVVRVLVFNDEGQLLIQRRGANVLSPLKLDQSAAGHVDAGETYEAAATRELAEELRISGFSLQLLQPPFRTSHFYNAVYVVTIPTDYPVQYNTDEVDSVTWMDFSEFKEKISTSPQEFTASFVEVWHVVCDKIQGL
jgi:isopentenyldiphosphate isomerase